MESKHDKAIDYLESLDRVQISTTILRSTLEKMDIMKKRLKCSRGDLIDAMMVDYETGD